MVVIPISSNKGHSNSNNVSKSNLFVNKKPKYKTTANKNANIIVNNLIIK